MKKILFLVLISFIFAGCTYYKSIDELKANVKPSDMDVTLVEAKFDHVKKSILANTSRCFSIMYNVDGECKVHTNTSTKVEVSCSREMPDSYFGSSTVNVLVPYIKAEKVDSAHTRISVYSTYGQMVNTTVIEWAEDVHQMCPSIM